MHKPIFLTIFGALGAFLAYKLYTLRQFGNNSAVNISLGRKPDIINLDLITYGTLRLWIDVEVINPQRQTFQATHPYVLVFNAAGTRIGNSIAAPSMIHKIEPGRNIIKDIEIRVPVKELIDTSNAVQILAAIADIIMNSSFTSVQKTREVYKVVLSAIKGKSYLTRTSFAIDGVVVNEQYTITF